MPATLDAIRTKVRRLTRTPSEAQLTTAQLDEYVNTFILYDFPEHLRTFNLRSTFTFYTSTMQDTYETDEVSFAGAITNPLYNFQNLYISVHDPVYIAGYQVFYTQSREQFFGVYPMINSIQSINSTGDGVTTSFTGSVNAQGAIFQPGQSVPAGLLEGEVLFSSVGTDGVGLALVDVPLVDTATGYKLPIGNLYVPGTEPALPPTAADLNPLNNINYLTGNFVITFPFAPAANAPISSQTVPQILGLPKGVLYYDNKFVVRPIPDQPYRIQIEVYQRPTELMSGNSVPNLEEWWQYIAYGAARKVFQDRMDIESVALLGQRKKQEALCLRRTIVQYTNERVATIYTESVTPGTGGFGWGGFGGQ